MDLSTKENRIFELLGQKQQSGQAFSGKESRIFELMSEKIGGQASPQASPFSQPDTQQQGGMPEPQGMMPQPPQQPQELTGEESSYWDRPEFGERADKSGVKWHQLPYEVGTNVEQSAFNLAKDLTSMVAHPIKTAKGVKDLVTGIFHKFTDDEQPDEKDVDRFVGFWKDRYGGNSFGEVMENIKYTLAKDPVGVVDDMAMFFTGGATGAAKIAKVVGRGGSKVARLADAAGKIGKNLDVSGKMLGVPQKAVGKVGDVIKDKLAPKNPAEKFYSKLAPHLSIKGDVAKSDDIVKYFIDNGLQINRKTIEQMENMRVESGKVIDSLVTEATKAGGEIATKDVAKAYHDMVLDPGKFKLDGHDVAKNRKFLLEGYDAFVKEKGDFMTTRDLQDLKTSIGPKYKSDLGEQMGKAKEKVNQELYKNAKDILSTMLDGTEYASANRKFGMSKEISQAIDDSIKSMEKSGGWSKSGLLRGGLGKVGSSLGLGAVGMSQGGALVGGSAFIGSLAALAILSNSHVQVKIINRIAKNGRMRKSLAQKAWKKELDTLKEVAQRQYKDVGLQTTKARKREEEQQ